MTDKTQILTTLREEFKQWEEFLADMLEGQITAVYLPSNWSIKDEIAHLWAWQQRSIARMEAALHNREPEFPKWPTAFDPEEEGEPDQLNAWLHNTYRDKPWAQVHEDWREGFLRFLELGEAIPEQNLLEPGRYAWLDGHPLSYILVASCEHHEEHREWLLARLRQDGA